MSRGIIYVIGMDVSGITYLGSAKLNDYVAEVKEIENSGGETAEKYSVLLDGYEQKHRVLDQIFSHCKIGDTSMYAVDPEMVVQLMKAFQGEQIFPATERTEVEILKNEQSKMKENWGRVPTGTYYLTGKRKLFGTIDASMYVEGGLFVVKSGSECFPVVGIAPKIREEAIIENGELIEDVVCHSPSAAATLVLGKKTNGWTAWKNIDGMPIDVYRRPEIHDGIDKRYRIY